MRYDRAGRSEGVAFVIYGSLSDAKTAIREFDGANAKGQPIRLQLIPSATPASSRRDNPFDRVENPRSLFDRIEAPRESRRRSESPRDDDDDDERGHRRGGGAPRRNPRDPATTSARDRDRRSDTTKPPPENIDRYIPGQRGGRSSSHRGAGAAGAGAGRRPGERREQRAGGRRDDNGHALVGGRPRKTAEELDAEMEDYWGGGNDDKGHGGENGKDAGGGVDEVGDDDQMIE